MRYNWHTILCRFTVCNMIWYMCSLQSDYPNKVSEHIHHHHFHENLGTSIALHWLTELLTNPPGRVHQSVVYWITSTKFSLQTRKQLPRSMAGPTVIYIHVSTAIYLPTYLPSFLCSKAPQFINHEGHQRNQAMPPGATPSMERKRMGNKTEAWELGWNGNKWGNRERGERKKEDPPFTEPLHACLTC